MDQIPVNLSVKTHILCPQCLVEMFPAGGDDLCLQAAGPAQWNRK